MKTVLKLTFITSMLLMAGCAQMVKKSYHPVRGGTVKYSTAWFLGDKNREKAVEEMKLYCGRQRAQLLSEDSKIEFTGNSSSRSQSNGDGSSYTSTNASKEGYVYMHFKCVSSKKVAQN